MNTMFSFITLLQGLVTDEACKDYDERHEGRYDGYGHS